MKKLVTAALVLAMTVGCLAGCGGSGASEEKDANAFYIGGIEGNHRLLAHRHQENP